MHFSNWLLFCGVALLVTFSPGPAVLLGLSLLRLRSKAASASKKAPMLAASASGVSFTG